MTAKWLTSRAPVAATWKTMKYTMNPLLFQAGAVYGSPERTERLISRFAQLTGED